MPIGRTRLLQVDAFTGRPFAGNPAAVCLLADPPDHVWMQLVAAEMNLSETAFVSRRSDGDFDLRWFTPTVEVALCGHATLASAHALWEVGLLDEASDARFHTRSGLLTARRHDGAIAMDFPTQADVPTDAPEGLLEALGVSPRYVGKNQTDFLVELGSDSEVRAVRPDFGRLALVPMRGVMVTAVGSGVSVGSADAYDFVSRFFAPAVGVAEDPVTGSAHCCLGPFWQRRLGRDALTGFQASARGGVVRLRMVGDRVTLCGRAVTIFSTELLC